MVGFFKGAAECFLEDGVPRLSLNICGCWWHFLTTAFDRGRREVIRWRGHGAFGGVTRDELLGKPGCGYHVDIGGTNLVIHHIKSWEAIDVFPCGVRHFSLRKMSCLEVENP